MSHLAKIFEPWGGNAEALAADIGENAVTVRAWRNRGSIHSDHWPKIIRAAFDKHGAQLRFEDFVPPEVIADLPRHVAGASGGTRATSPTKAPAIIGAEAAGCGQADDSAPELALSGAPDIFGDDIREGQGADSPGPFSPAPSSGASHSTFSLTDARPNMPAASAACSTGSRA